MTDQVQTLGPIDPNAPLVAKVYSITTSLLGLVTLAQTVHLITAPQAASLSTAGGAVGTAVGAVITAIAAFRTHKQVKNGTFDAAPPTPTVLAPQDQAVASIQQTVQQAVAAAAGVQQVKQTIDDLINKVPGVNLVDQVIDGVLHSSR